MRLLIPALWGMCFSFCFPVVVAAGVYKWVDADGNTHYSQVPPRNQEAKSMKLPKNKVSANSGSTQISTHAKQETASRKTQDMIDGAKSMLLNAKKDGDKLDCEKAVSNTIYSIDTMLENARKNVKSGHLEQAKYDQLSEKLTQAKQSASISDCESSSGNDMKYYLCMSNGMNHMLGCAKKYKP